MFNKMHVPFQELISIHDTENVLARSGKNFLSIELSPGGFSYCVLDTDRFRYTMLESYSVDQANDFEQLGNLLEQFTRQKKILSSYYQRISCSYISPKAVLVPSDLFSYVEKREFGDFNIYPDEDFELKVDKLNNLSAYNIYPVPKVLLKKINFLFPGNRIRHHASCLIENVIYQIRYGRSNVQLVLHIQKDHFEILYFEGESLSFYNSFLYQTWDDLFYYLFFVLEQLGLDAEKLHAMILGEVSIKSEFYKKMRLYVKSLSFGPRSDLYKYSDGFDEIPHHYYFNLLNLNSCG
jgi:hypothetical protein